MFLPFLLPHTFNSCVCFSGSCWIVTVYTVMLFLSRAPSSCVQPVSSRQPQRGRRSRGGKDTAGLSPHSSTESMDGCDPCMLFLLLSPSTPLPPIHIQSLPCPSPVCWHVLSPFFLPPNKLVLTASVKTTLHHLKYSEYCGVSHQLWNLVYHIMVSLWDVSELSN